MDSKSVLARASSNRCVVACCAGCAAWASERCDTMRRSKQRRVLGELAMLGAMGVLQLAGKPRVCEAYPAFRDEIPNGLRAGDQSSGMYA